MSTTVTYEGETITTVSNSTATLQTSGKWLTDNITIVDVSSGSDPDGDSLGYGWALVGTSQVGSAVIA